MQSNWTTRVQDTPVAPLRALREVVKHHILRSNADDWRHHGIGCLQSYIAESDMGELRVHVWSPDLVLAGMAVSGDIHNHRFDLYSTVLIGSMTHTEYRLTHNHAGDYEVYSLVNARESLTTNGSFHTEPQPVGLRFDLEAIPFVLCEGDSYTFPRGHYHSTRPEKLTISVVAKGNQSGYASLIGKVGEPLKNAFGNPENVTDPADIGFRLQAAVEALQEELDRGRTL